MTADLRQATSDVNAANLLRSLPTRPRLLALGEPTHGEESLLGLRNDLFHQLVEEGYRTIAVESDCLRAGVVDDYVTTGVGTLDDVLVRGFSHDWGALPGNRELVRWMHGYNAGRPASEQLHFAGFDGPLEITGAASPRPALTALHSALATAVPADLLPCTAGKLDRLLGSDEAWTDIAAMRDPSRSVGQTPEARELRLLADDLAALLVEYTPPLVADSRQGWDRACLHARTATGLLRYHHWMADSSPGRLARLLGVRDSMMAANLLALSERGSTVVYAHNSHLQRDRSAMRMGGLLLHWWSAGAIVSTQLGQEYAFLATALGTILHRDVGAPPPDTAEGLLYALGRTRCLVDTRRLADALGEIRPAPRESPWYGYAPLDPDQLASLDGIVFVRDCQPAAG